VLCEYLDMSVPNQPGNRRQLAVILCLVIGIPVIVVGLIVLGVYAIITPRHFAVLQYGGVACAASADSRSVYVQMTLTERDQFPLMDTAKLDGPSNASLAQYGWLTPPVGYAFGDTRPSKTELAKAFSGSRSPRPLPSRRSNLVLRIAVDPTRLSSVDGVDLLIDNGEPAYDQTLLFHLKTENGRCTVDKG
jgi:hypothetical protein